MVNDNRASGNRGSITLLGTVVVVAVLYFARTVLIPLALAVLLAFLLAPVVVRLRRWGLGRIPSAVGVVLLAFGVMAVIGLLMASQLTDLAHKLPEYQKNIDQKVETVRTSGGGLVNRLSGVMREFTDGFTPTSANPAKNQAGERPVPVEIRRSPFSPLEAIQTVLGSVLNVAVTAAVVVVFVIFMLIEREDLRDRFIGLAGRRRVNITTKILDDAAHRVSRYLVAQLVVNVAYGVIAGIGLYFIGVPNPLLWGMLAALLRYVPYLGIWIAAVMPAAVAFAVEPGWVKVPVVFGLYFGIDLTMYNLVEPLLYGTSTGVSPLAILVAAVFWTWLWGPVGLLLSTPLTVCVVVLGRHVPNLGFLQVLLSDEPVLALEVRFYQRLLAMDLDEATELAEQFLKGKSLEELYDRVIIPALSLAEEDRHHGRLDEPRQQFIFNCVRELVEDLATRADEVIQGTSASTAQSTEREPRPGIGSTKLEGAVVCIPARDEADENAAFMLLEALRRRGIEAKALGADALASEHLEEVEREHPQVVCVLAVPPFGYMHARYLCRRLRDRHPGLKTIAAILTEQDVRQLRERQPPVPADELASSLSQVLTLVPALLQARTGALPAPAPALSVAT